jgi:hypothetical protein
VALIRGAAPTPYYCYAFTVTREAQFECYGISSDISLKEPDRYHKGCRLSGPIYRDNERTPQVHNFDRGFTFKVLRSQLNMKETGDLELEYVVDQDGIEVSRKEVVLGGKRGSELQIKNYRMPLVLLGPPRPE